MYEKHLTLMLLSLALKILKRFFRIIKSQGERNLKVWLSHCYCGAASVAELNACCWELTLCSGWAES